MAESLQSLLCLTFLKTLWRLEFIFSHNWYYLTIFKHTLKFYVCIFSLFTGPNTKSDTIQHQILDLFQKILFQRIRKWLAFALDRYLFVLQIYKWNIISLFFSNISFWFVSDITKMAGLFYSMLSFFAANPR